jgi:hypothetical protein
VIWGLGQAAQAHAAPVLVLGAGGQITVQQQPLPLTETPVPLAGHRAHLARSVARANVVAALGRLQQRGRISNATYTADVGSMRSALHTESRLSGTPAAELGAVIANLRQITAAGMLTPARLPALFLTLNRNVQWWSTGQVPGGGQIINFAGSQIDWQYYPGQGLELQVLASFGKANWWLSHGAQYTQQGTGLLSELIPLASRRSSGVTWEYYFNFDGGAPPWTSAMSQGTALAALAHAFQATGNRAYLLTARHALPVFTTSPWRGVSEKTARGLRFVQYTFDPSRKDEIINAFLQALIGLYTYAHVSNNPLAMRLFNQGNAEAKHEVPYYDTGSWSLYQPGIADTMSYHELVTGFLQQLCTITQARVYCTTAAHFESYAQHPPSWVVQ